MPIRKENRNKYPKDWKAISARIRFARAGGRCECTGQCGEHEDERCEARHGEPHPVTGSKVVLTTMHMDHDPTNNDDSNLMAGCQTLSRFEAKRCRAAKCHNRYDAPMRRRGVVERKSLPLLELALLSVFLVITPAGDTPAQTPLPPVPQTSVPQTPPRPVADSVVRQAGDHAEGVFGGMSRAGVGGQIQDAWDDTDNEAGVFDFALCQDCTYKVRLREHMVTVLELPEGEVIERADVGDGGSFDVQTRGPRRLAVKPLGFGIDSNLMIYGASGTVYPVYLRAESFNSVNVPDLFVRIVGQVSIADPALAVEGVGLSGSMAMAGDGAGDDATYMTSPEAAPLTPVVQGSDDRGLPPPRVAGDRGLLPPRATGDRGLLPPRAPFADGPSEDFPSEDFVRDVPFDADALRGWGDYALWAGGPDGDALRPETVFRDDQFTYIRFGERWKDVELPTAYVVVDDIDELVNTRVQGSTYIIESTRPLITLKSGLSYLCIRYEGDSS